MWSVARVLLSLFSSLLSFRLEGRRLQGDNGERAPWLVLIKFGVGPGRWAASAVTYWDHHPLRYPPFAFGVNYLGVAGVVCFAHWARNSKIIYAKRGYLSEWWSQYCARGRWNMPNLRTQVRCTTTMVTLYIILFSVCSSSCSINKHKTDFPGGSRRTRRTRRSRGDVQMTSALRGRKGVSQILTKGREFA